MVTYKSANQSVSRIHLQSTDKEELGSNNKYQLETVMMGTK